jgi:hypothetical protein
MVHRLAGSVAATALLFLLAAPVMAGGWADIVADAQTGTTPIAARPFAVGFKVMQHGITPAPWETATVHFVEVGSGDAIDVVASNDDPNGHFTASVTLPRAGLWSWHVTLANLQSTHVPVTIGVRTADGRMPAIDPASLIAAIDRAKADIRSEMATQFGQRIDQVSQQADEARARLTSLAAQVEVLRAESNTSASRSTATPQGNEGLPILAIVTLAVLAGAAAGFTMTWLAGRQADRPTTGLSPVPGGADPA